MRDSASHSRFALLALPLLAFLAVGVCIAPRRLNAQQPAPSAQAQPAAPAAAEGESAAKGEPAKAEENETDRFRHTPLVQTVARALHQPVETMARIFEFINFGILVVGLVFLLRGIPKIFRKRSETLRQNIEAGRKASEEANARLSAVEVKLSHLDEEIVNFRTEVEQEIVQDEVRFKAGIEEEKSRIIASAEQEIAVAAAQARRGLRQFVAELAVDQAAKKLDLTAEGDRALIAEFVSQVTESGPAQGGKN